MPGDGPLVPLIQTFAVVLARVSSALVLVPVPGAASLPKAGSVVFAVALTFILYPFWPSIAVALTAGEILRCIVSETAFGCAVGLAVAACVEAFQMFAQLVGLQAGYSYASTVDPTTQSDSTVLQSAIRLFVGVSFFALGFHAAIIRAFAESLHTIPPGSFVINEGVFRTISPLLSGMFSAAVRLSIPVVGFLLLTDIVLAVVGRIDAHLQLTSVAFSAKMIVGLLMMAALLPAAQDFFARSLAGCISLLARLHNT